MSEETVRRIDRSYELSPAQETPEGYIFTTGTISRPGVMKYRSRDGSIIRELIDAKDLADPASIESLKRKVLTLDHPKEDVGPRNFQAFAVGDVGADAEIAEDESLQSGVYAKRLDAISAIRSGAHGLSAGYTCKIDKTPGVHPVFGPYDQRQHSRRYNHVAIVTKGQPRADRTFLRYDSDAFEVEDADDSINTEETQMSDQPVTPPAAPAIEDKPPATENKPALNTELASALGLKDSSSEAIKAAVAELQNQSRQDSTQREIEMLSYANKRAPLLNLAKKHGIEFSDKTSNDELLKNIAIKISPDVARRDSVGSEYYQAVIDLHAEDQTRGLRQPPRSVKRTDSKEPESVSVRASQHLAVKEANEQIMKQFSK